MPFQKPNCVAYSNARIPSNTTPIQHIQTPNAEACQQECQNLDKCNVFAYEPSSFAPNCTLGTTSNYTQMPSYSSDSKAQSGYCISPRSQKNQVFFPPIR